MPRRTKKQDAAPNRIYFCGEHKCHVSDCFSIHNPNAHAPKKRTRKKKEA